MSAESRCLFMGGVQKFTAGYGTSNRDRWLKQLNLDDRPASNEEERTGWQGLTH
jgi:hypothetical protein